MAAHCREDGIHATVLHPKLVTCFANDGCYLHVVGLDDAREEVVGSLVVEGS